MAQALQNYQNHIQELSRPLFENTDIDYFDYVKMQPDSSGIYLSSNTALNVAMIQQQVHSSYGRLQYLYQHKHHVNSIQNAFYFLTKEDNIGADKIFKAANYSNTFVIVDIYDTYIDAFTFASSSTEDLVRFCFSHLDVLVHFKNYFLTQSKQLIQVAEQHAVVFSKDKVDYKALGKKHSNSQLAVDSFYEALPLKRYLVKFKKQQYEITARELDCLKYLAMGRKDKETARLIGLAPKTIEHYIDHLKKKFKVQRRSQLIDIYLVSDLAIL